MPGRNPFVLARTRRSNTVSDIGAIAAAGGFIIHQRDKLSYAKCTSAATCHRFLLANQFLQHRKGILSLENRKSTRLNSSHVRISYAVFSSKKKNTFTD